MNPRLDLLQPYPFQKLAGLFEGLGEAGTYAPIDLSIGEPKHPTPEFIKAALTENLQGLASYPATLGGKPLRQSIAAWLERRYAVGPVDPETQILPVNGSREALFAFAQAVVDPTADDPVVVSPNPFYQIYEGAALLAGARPAYLNLLECNAFAWYLEDLNEETWAKTQLLYVCSPGNPTGRVLTLAEWHELFAYSDRYGFTIAADECYSEIYADEENPPLGALAAATQLGRDGYPRLVVFSSLSKRSNVPGMRSGFVAGDADILKRFLHYRTYHGSAMSPAVQAASAAAWADEEHVRENRRLYRAKFEAVAPTLAGSTAVAIPEGGFYLWLSVPGSDTEFARRLKAEYNVTVLPGSYLGRTAGPGQANPGDGFVRVALVAPLDECVEAAGRMRGLFAKL